MTAEPAQPGSPLGGDRLARLQQATTLGLVGSALAWALGWAQADRPVLAVTGALGIASLHALVLGIEFMLLMRVHGDDPTPRATLRQLLAAWWGEVLAAPRVFCWLQPFRSRRWPDHLPAAARGRRGVLLVHGFVCNRGLWNRWLRRLRAADVPVIAINLEPVFGSIDELIGGIEAAVQRLEQATGQAPVIVAHSMGGLVTRRWLAERGGPGRVHHVVTLGTPHHGTWLARLAMSRNARQMRQRSPWLQTLAQREGEARRAPFTCFYSHCDNIVFPPATATLAGADNRHLPAVAHVHMAEHPAPWARLQELLAAPPADDQVTPNTRSPATTTPASISPAVAIEARTSS